MTSWIAIIKVRRGWSYRLNVGDVTLTLKSLVFKSNNIHPTLLLLIFHCKNKGHFTTFPLKTNTRWCWDVSAAGYRRRGGRFFQNVPPQCKSCFILQDMQTPDHVRYTTVRSLPGLDRTHVLRCCTHETSADVTGWNEWSHQLSIFLAAVCSLVIILLPGIDFWIAGRALLLWTERFRQYKSYHYTDKVK